MLGPETHEPIGTDGNYAADIGAFDTSGSSLSQDIALSWEGNYRLTFDWLANALGTPGLTATLQVSFRDTETGSLLGQQTFTQVSGDFVHSGALGFESEQMHVIVPAGVGTVTLEILDLSANDIDGVDPLVDNFRLVRLANDGLLAITPEGGTYENTVEVTIANTTGAGIVRYTLDGSEPVASSQQYTGPFTLNESALVRARLFVNSFPASDEASASFTITEPLDIAFVPNGGLFTNALEVVLVNHLSEEAPGSVIRFTLDGSSPTSASPAYAAPLALTSATTIRAVVFFNTFPVSAEYSASFSRVYSFEDDGVPFAWRELHFGPGFLTDPDAAAAADPDQDGYTNAEEYASGTLPGDGESAPEILLTVRAVPKLTFTTLPGKTYRILRSESLSVPQWEVVVPAIVAEGDTLSYLDADAPTTAYYQIELVLP